MRVYIVEDKIIDADTDQVLDSGYEIFREAIRKCRKEGWKWAYADNGKILTDHELKKQRENFFPRLPEKHLFDQKLHRAVYNTLVKYGNGYVPRPYVTARLVMRDLWKKGESVFFGLWFACDGHRVCYCCGEDRAKVLWVIPD